MDDTDEPFWDQAQRKRLGDTVAAWMAAKGVKKAVLARDAGVGRGTLDKLLAGATKPEIETIAKVAARLGTTVGALLDGTQPKVVTISATAGSGKTMVLATLAALAADLVVLDEGAQIEPLEATVRQLVGRVNALTRVLQQSLGAEIQAAEATLRQAAPKNQSQPKAPAAP